MPSLENQWVYCVVYGSTGERLPTWQRETVRCITEETIRAWVMTPQKSYPWTLWRACGWRSKSEHFLYLAIVIFYVSFTSWFLQASLLSPEERKIAILTQTVVKSKIVYPGFEHSPFTYAVPDLQIMLCLAKRPQSYVCHLNYGMRDRILMF